MKDKSNKFFLFFYFYFYIIRDMIFKDKELLSMIKGVKYGFIFMNLYSLYNTLYYLFTLGVVL